VTEPLFPSAITRDRRPVQASRVSQIRRFRDHFPLTHRSVGDEFLEDWPPLIAPNSGNDTIADIGCVVRNVTLALRAIVGAPAGAVAVSGLVEADR
jgi:hypothetical protein